MIVAASVTVISVDPPRDSSAAIVARKELPFAVFGLSFSRNRETDLGRNDMVGVTCELAAQALLRWVVRRIGRVGGVFEIYSQPRLGHTANSCRGLTGILQVAARFNSVLQTGRRVFGKMGQFFCLRGDA